MGRVRVKARLTARFAAHVLVFGGGVVIACGVFLLWGLGFALMTAGAGAVAAGLFFIDVDRR